MLDIKLIKENPQSVIDRLRAKGKEAEADICRVIELDAKRRELIASSESLKAEQNKTTKLVPIYKKEGKDCAPIFAQMKELGAKVKEQEEELKRLEEEAIQAKDKAKQELRGNPAALSKKKVSARELIDNASRDMLHDILDEVINLDYEFIVDKILEHQK